MSLQYCLSLSSFLSSGSFDLVRDVLKTRQKQDKTKTRQDKTRQDKTRQDKTRQDKTRQDKTRQARTRQDKTKASRLVLCLMSWSVSWSFSWVLHFILHSCPFGSRTPAGFVSGLSVCLSVFCRYFSLAQMSIRFIGSNVDSFHWLKCRFVSLAFDLFHWPCRVS